MLLPGPVLLVGLLAAQAPTELQAAVAHEPTLRDGQEVDDLRRHDLTPGEGVATELTSSWFAGLGARRGALAESGYSLEAFLTVDASAHPSGGADSGSTSVRALFDAIVTVDTARAFGLEGGQLVLGLQALGGDDGSARVGLAQSYSNIDAADDRVQLARFWYQHEWHEGWTRLRLGKMDANGSFAGVANAARFIHSSMGFSPTILGLPTYPDSAFGVTLRQSVTSAGSLSLGVFDGAGQEGVKTGERGLGSVFGAPADLFVIAQASGKWEGAARPGRLALGAWQHTGDFARFDGGSEDGTGGLYAVLEQQASVQGRALDLFLQLGEADEDVAAISRHVGLGVTSADVFLPEREDALGLGLSWAGFSEASGAGFGADSETALELFYGFRLVPGVRLKPDIQYVVDPGGDAALDDAWILTLRMTASL